MNHHNQVDTASMVVKRGIDAVVFISEFALSQIRLFRSAGVRVVTKRAQPEEAPRIRAVPHMNGYGEVQVSEPFVYAPREEEEMIAIEIHRQVLGFKPAGGTDCVSRSRAGKRDRGQQILVFEI